LLLDTASTTTLTIFAVDVVAAVLATATAVLMKGRGHVTRTRLLKGRHWKDVGGNAFFGLRSTMRVGERRIMQWIAEA